MISKQSFGRTGHASTRVLFGAYALSKATQAEADGVLELLLAYGVNHIDTAIMYGNAEKRIGPWMRHGHPMQKWPPRPQPLTSSRFSLESRSLAVLS